MIADSERTHEVSGVIQEVYFNHGRPACIVVEDPDGQPHTIGTMPKITGPRTLGQIAHHVFEGSPKDVLEVDKTVSLKPGDQPEVDVTRFEIAGVAHYDFVRRGQPVAADYDNRRLPQFLFFGAALLTLLMLLSIARPIRQLLKQGVS
jgi:hypothetical protein